MRLKAVLVAGAVTAALVSLNPNAIAAGNCYHYGVKGYVQFFTDINFQGDCHEIYGDPEYVGSIFYRSLENEWGGKWRNSISSIRGWHNSNLHLHPYTYLKGAAYTWNGSAEVPALPKEFNDRGQSLSNID